jgi:hypothetical protein
MTSQVMADAMSGATFRVIVSTFRRPPSAVRSFLGPRRARGLAFDDNGCT